MTWQLLALTIIWTSAPGCRSSWATAGATRLTIQVSAAGTDDGLGLGAARDDPLDGARDLVAGGEAGDGISGEQDVVGADLDQ